MAPHSPRVGNKIYPPPLHNTRPFFHSKIHTRVRHQTTPVTYKTEPTIFTSSCLNSIHIQKTKVEENMQTGKNAAAAVKETAANISASARSGMEKTKATLQEKVDKTKAHDQGEKALAAEKKDEVKCQADINKMQAKEENAAQKQAATAHPSTVTAGTHGVATGPGGVPLGTDDKVGGAAPHNTGSVI